MAIMLGVTLGRGAMTLLLALAGALAGRVTTPGAASVTNLEGVDAENQSALNLLYALVWEGTESDERYTLSGGTDTLISALGELYADQIQLGRALEALLVRADGTYSGRLPQHAAKELPCNANPPPTSCTPMPP